MDIQDTVSSSFNLIDHKYIEINRSRFQSGPIFPDNKWHSGTDSRSKLRRVLTVSKTDLYVKGNVNLIRQLHSANRADNTPPATDYFDELRVVRHAYCRDVYAKYINGNQGAVKRYFMASWW